jgi:hypothetical protein
MFAQPVTKRGSKTAANSTGKLAPQRSTPVKHRLGHDPVDQEILLQRTFGNQTTLRYLSERHEQQAATKNMTARETPPGASWDFSKIPLFAPDRTSRFQTLDPPAALLLPATIQPKLTIGRSDDPLEDEANRVADQMMRNAVREGAIYGAPLDVRRKCAACEEKTLLPKATVPLSKATADGAPGIANEVLGSPGQPLDADTRFFFESRFGHDFSRVTVHADSRAAESARAVNALAYTVGHDIVFGAGEYAPGTATGRKLLAHELTHVVQQRAPVARSPAAVDQASAALMRKIAYDPDCQPDQKEVEGNVSRAQASAARWADAALTSLTKPENVGSLLRRHFSIQATDVAAVAQIRSHFQSIVAALNADMFIYHCRPTSDARCRAGDGQEVAAFTYPGKTDIFFCDPYPFQNFFGHKNLIDALLHEAAHAHDASFNHDTYEWQGAYPGPNPLTNADCYASFARDVALGRGGTNLEVSTGVLLSADPQFYIAVGTSGEVGGPALDLLNLTLGVRVAYLPGTGRQPTRGLLSTDVGLRINPIGARVYVDVTTGAYFGANFTDNELMAGIANRLSAGYRGDRVDLGLDLNYLRDFVGDKNLVIVGVRGAVRF